MSDDLEDGDDLTCRECGLTYQLEDGKEPCEYCYGCVYNVLDRVTAERDALKAALKLANTRAALAKVKP